jgi:hypothetical protein
MRVDSDPHFAYESSLSVELSEQKGAMKRLFKTDVPIRRFHKADRTMEVWTQGAAGKRRSGPKIAWPFSLPIVTCGLDMRLSIDVLMKTRLEPGSTKAPPY